ncbi:MAG: two-component regulator propeller domain-containing protein [Bacteroidia bacterium]
MHRYAFLFLGLLSGTLFLRGQTITLPALHYAAEDGLPDSKVRCLLQDSRGFLWIGTENGLSCFDGRMFNNYFSGEGTDPISGNYITAITEDRTGILWIATLDGGLTRLDMGQPEGDRSRIFYFLPDDSTSLPVNRLRCLIDFDDDYLLLSGEQAPVVFVNKKTFQFLSWKGELPLHPSNAITSHDLGKGWLHFLKKIAPGEILMSFLNNRRVLAIDTHTGQQVQGFNQPDYFAGDQTYVCMAWDEKYAYAGGWQNGITYWERAGDGFTEKIQVPDEVETLLMFSPGRLLAGGHNKGLFEINTTTRSIQKIDLFLKKGKPLNPERIMAMIMDKDSSIWLGTNAGLIRLSPGKKNSQTGLLLPSEDSKLIFGTGISPEGRPMIFSSKGIYEQQVEKGDFTLLSFTWKNQPLQVTGLVKTSSFGWVMGTENGLFFYDPANRKIRPFPPLMQVEGYTLVFDFFQIRNLYEDTIAEEPVIVAGVLGYGVIVINLAKKTITLLIDQKDCNTCIKINLVRKVLKTPDGNYWVATSRGLYYWEFDHRSVGGLFVPYYHLPENPHSLSSDDILDIALDEENTLWVATRNGLNSIAGTDIRRYKFPVSRGNVILSVVPAGGRNVLVSSTAGMGLFDQKTQNFSYISESNASGADAPWMAGRAISNQSVLVAGQNHWEIVRVENLRILPEPPIPYLVGFSVNNRPQMGAEEYTLGYRDYFSARISALSLNHSSDFDLEYRFGAIDQVWQALPAEGSILMSNLRPGKHNLEVRVVAKNGEIFHETSILQLRVRPPFWLSWPFILSMVVLFTGSVFSLYRYRLFQHQKRLAIRMDIASDLHDEVGSALGSISMGSELAGKFLESDIDKSKQVLENIRSITGKTLQNMADIIWAINPKHDQGEKITAKMRQVGNDLLGSGGIAVTYTFGPEIEPLRLSMHARKNIMLIYKEVLHNITKHASANSVAIDFLIYRKHLILKIKDDGKGFIPGSYPGNGLGNMQRRAELLGGKLDLHTEPGEGVEVILKANLLKIRE